MNPLLRLANVDAGYGKKTILKDISLSVHRGEVLALIGPNGSGKTTMVRVMCRTIQPTAGRIELEGRSIWHVRSREYAQRVAYVGQSEKLAWPFRVEQLVLMGRFPHRGWISAYTAEDHEAAERALCATGLLTMRDRTVHTLSGGEAQRAMIARSLAQSPEILVLDEPIAHLDLRHQVEVLETVRGFAAKGLAVVICLHDLTQAAFYADRVALLQDGLLRAVDRPERVLTETGLEEVYGTPVAVGRFPGTDRLMVAPMPLRRDQSLSNAER